MKSRPDSVLLKILIFLCYKFLVSDCESWLNSSLILGEVNIGRFVQRHLGSDHGVNSDNVVQQAKEDHILDLCHAEVVFGSDKSQMDFVKKLNIGKWSKNWIIGKE